MIDEKIIDEEVISRLETNEIRAKIQEELEQIAANWQNFSINE